MLGSDHPNRDVQCRNVGTKFNQLLEEDVKDDRQSFGGIAAEVAVERLKTHRWVVWPNEKLKHGGE